MVDCRSLTDHLQKEHFTRVTDKRLAVELLALRQLLWERKGVLQDCIDPSSGDSIRWVDTSRMLADCLTKAMKATELWNVLGTCVLDLTPTPDSVYRKQVSQACRKRKQQAEAGVDIDADAPLPD